MKKFLSLALTFAVSSLGLISILAQPVRAQQVASAGKSISEIKEEYERLLAVDRDPSTPSEVRELNHQFLEKRRTQLREAIAGRLGALRKYQTSMNGMLSAEEGLVVGNSIQALEKDLSGLSGEQKAAPVMAAAIPRARLVNTASTTTPASGDAAPVSPAPKASSGAVVTGNLFTTETAVAHAAIVRSIILSGNPTCQQGSLTITLNAASTATSPLTITVTETATSNVIDTRTVALGFNVFTYTSGVNLAVGNNTITVTDAGGTESATTNLLGVSCAPPPPEPSRIVGLLLGGTVISQQAENMSQADPFMGFVVGYDDLPSMADIKSGKDAKWRAHWRVQAIFQVEPKKEEAPVEGTGEGADNDNNGNPDPADFRSFLASRKAFDVDMSFWYDRPANRHLIFGGGNTDPNFRLGPYFAVGGTAYMSKNELKGDDSVKVENTNGSGGNTANDQVELDTDRAKVDNDIDFFAEAGLIGNFFKGVQKGKPELFMQVKLGYGRYEALQGFNPGKTGFFNDSRNRFVGKLRIFPMFLERDPEGGANASPMFGVEINAGRGPDQIKFFTGIATAFKLASIFK
jgi:hypothetical protein